MLKQEAAVGCVAHGPTGLLITTTAAAIESQTETRILSITVNDTPEQTKLPRVRLLFPTEDGGMRTDIRKLLDRLGERAGWKAGEIRSKMFRHTYCAARLQTLDHGAPVGVYTVARELGHGSTAMAEQVYAHLGTIRHRGG